MDITAKNDPILPRMSDDARQRFWNKVHIGLLKDCWEWQGSRTRWEYGRFAPSHGDKPMFVHRISYTLTRNEEPDDLVVRHFYCDNPPCCNPSHLEIGTSADNVADMMRKGRHGTYKRTQEHKNGAAKRIKQMFRENPGIYQGARNPMAKLNDTQVLEIRTKYGTGTTSSEILGREYGVSGATILQVVRGEKWKHISDERVTNYPGQGMRPELAQRGEDHPGSKLTAEQVLEIRAKYKGRHTPMSKIAGEYGVCGGTISSIVQRKIWTHIP